MDDQIYLVIAGTFVGFIALAFFLLYPIYRFLTREERADEHWTPEALAKRQARTSGDGTALPVQPPAPPDPDAP